MKRLTLDNLIEAMVELVPEFRDYEDFGVWDINDNEVKRLLLGVFGRFFTERVKNYPGGDPVIKRVYEFLNEQFNESDSDREALDYLGIEIFENLCSFKEGVEVSRKLLKGNALKSFNETAKYFYSDKD